jgi:hypothetical protein
MSFIRFLYNAFFKKFLDKSFTLNDFYSLLAFINDIKGGKVIDKYEAVELDGSQQLAAHICNGVELVPLIVDLLNDKKKGKEIKQSLLQHRVLVHSMFYNESHVLNQISQIIHELESTVRIEEERQGCMKVISPQTGSDLKKR